MSDDSRDNNGRFLPGHAQPGPGRPARAHEQQVLEAIRSHFPPDKIVGLLQEALDIARSTKSARGIVAVVTDVLDRTIGKPVQKVEEQGDKLDEFILQLRASRPAQIDEK